MDEGREVDAVYLDFSKAFDMVSHSIHVGQLVKIKIGKEDRRTDRRHPKSPGRKDGI